MASAGAPHDDLLRAVDGDRGAVALLPAGLLVVERVGLVVIGDRGHEPLPPPVVEGLSLEGHAPRALDPDAHAVSLEAAPADDDVLAVPDQDGDTLVRPRAGRLRGVEARDGHVLEQQLDILHPVDEHDALAPLQGAHVDAGLDARGPDDVELLAQPHILDDQRVDIDHARLLRIQGSTGKREGQEGKEVRTSAHLNYEDGSGAD